MQLFMRNIAFSVNEVELKAALAQKLHRPPFSTDTPINFHVNLFRAARSSRGTTHGGKGILTVPTTEIGENFLTIYGSGLVVGNRPVLFSPSTRAVNQGLVEMVRTTPWRDPETLREEKERRARLSGAIKLLRFSFGRFCRDGVFSAEASYPGKVACNVESRRIEITHNEHDDAKPALDSNDSDESPPSDPTEWLSHVLRQMRNLDFTAHMKSYDTVDASKNQVLLQADLPPTFERRKDFVSRFTDQEPIPERESSLRDANFRVTSRASQGLLLVFESNQDLDTFLERCRVLHLPRPLSRDIQVEERDIYSEGKLESLQNVLNVLDFGLAFEVEKAVWGGIMEPDEVVSMRESLLELQGKATASEPAAIFRYFLTTLSVPGLNSSLPSKKRRRRTKKQQVAASPLMDLRGKLAEAIGAYIAELYEDHDRPRRRYRPSPAICQSYQLTLTPSTQILEGPLPDQSNSDENRSPPRRDQKLSIDQLLETRYKKTLKSGLRVGGRSYEFLGYSMSGLKEYSFIFVTPFSYEGVRLSAQSIRDRLGDFSKILYQPALLGARWSQAFSTSDPSVTLEPNQIQLDGDKISATGSLFTDGCSSISSSLMRKVWKSLRASQRIPRPPSAIQYRCGGAKGVLVHNPHFPDNMLCFRPSQTKFEAADIRTLDIAATSARPILMYLNRPLIALLEHHGTSGEAFMGLQKLAIDEVQSIKDSLVQASRILLSMVWALPFACPPSSIFRHQLVKTALAYATTHILREIKHRAHIPVPGSYTLIGVSDEWDCLDEGEIYATVVDDRTGLNLPITGRLLITRSPQIHPGDVQFVTAVRKPQLEHLRNVVVFSCRGSRSLPSKLGGGDLDGDIYNLILDVSKGKWYYPGNLIDHTQEKLFPTEDFTAVPGEYVAIPPKITPLPCTMSDVADFVIDFIKSDLLGYISILHLRIADVEGLGCENCIKLAEHASHAVDFNKRGVPVNFKDLPLPPSNIRPDFLSGEGVNPNSDLYYPSAKILGMLYRSVPIEDYHPDPSELEVQLTDGNKIQTALTSIGLYDLGLPLLINQPREDLLEEMRIILDEYSDQLMVIAKTHTISKRANAYLSEAELVSGTIQERYSDHRKRREAVAAMNLQKRRILRKKMRTKTKTEDASSWDDSEDIAGDEEVRRDKFERAWAAWLVAEEALDDDPSAFGPSSFGLLALGTMLEVVKEALKST
ncbi:RdRP-domain-containing protein [Mycena latifolia]|nr:RdRP-domain-containing protein [Mycena latifolia]